MADQDFEFSCPACGGRLLGSPADMGQTMQCSYCSGTLTVPAPTPVQSATAPQTAPPPVPYATTPPAPPSWPGAYPPQPRCGAPAYGAPANGAVPYDPGPYRPPGYGPGPSVYPPPGSARRNIWPLVIVLSVVGVLLVAGIGVAVATRIPRSSMVAHWSLTKSATGRIASGRMDLNDDGTFSYQCTYVNGRSAHASGLWSLRNRRLILTIQSNTSNNPFGNSTLVHMDVTEVNGTTLHIHVKEGEQYWKHL
jgi:hypothetical protein